MLSEVLALLSACSAASPPSGAIALSRLDHLDTFEIVGVPTADVTAPVAVEVVRGADGLHHGSLPFPYLDHQRARRPNGLEVVSSLGSLTYQDDGRLRSWSVTGREITVRFPDAAPATTSLRVRWGPAISDERARDPANRTSDEAFVMRSLTLGSTTLHGAFLPAPSRAAWTFPLPHDARFETTVRLLPPAVLTTPPTGFARARVTIDIEGVEVASASCVVTLDEPCPLELDLAGHEGKVASVALVAEPLQDATFNDVFFVDPVVYTPEAHPRRVVVVFLDTMRRDRLGVYGATRATPNIDRFASDAVVFDTARTIASWTLPSVRAAHTGKQPEDWDDTPTLAERLAKHGWATTGIVNNAFLSPPLNMDRGYARYDYDFMAPAPEQIGRALSALERHPRRNQFVMVQFMDTHLPYAEPEPFRSMYTQDTPLRDGYGIGNLKHVTDPVVRQYTSDRYDQSVQFLDHSLAPLFAALRPDDVVILHSDHGDEFWEHGDVEHGHAIWEEVVRIPLMVRAPGLVARRIPDAVSLMDLTPTLLDLLGLPAVDQADGASLAPLLRGDGPAPGGIQAIGRTLHGSDAWGLVDGDRKWIAQRGSFQLFDLAADPAEQHPLTPTSEADRQQAVSRMAASLRREVRATISVRGPEKNLYWRGAEVSIELDAPLHAAWVGSSGPKRQPLIEANKVIWRGGGAIPGETYLLPTHGIGSVHQVRVTLKLGQRIWIEDWDPSSPGPLVVGPPANQLTVQVDLVPLPARIEVPSTNDEVEDELRALGYAE